jgi:hypothetical protein
VDDAKMALQRPLYNGNQESNRVCRMVHKKFNKPLSVFYKKIKKKRSYVTEKNNTDSIKLSLGLWDLVDLFSCKIWPRSTAI